MVVDLCGCRNHVFGGSSSHHQPVRIGIRQMPVQDHYYYAPGDYFFERNNHKPRKAALTIKCRMTPIVLCVWFVCQLALVDEWNLLPTGLLMFHVGIHMTMEEFAKEALLAEHQQQQLLQQRIGAAQFEYHVLRGRPHVQIVKLLENDGSTTLYAV